jgi:hypothetical protein
VAAPLFSPAEKHHESEHVDELDSPDPHGDATDVPLSLPTPGQNSPRCSYSTTMAPQLPLTTNGSPGVSAHGTPMLSPTITLTGPKIMAPRSTSPIMPALALFDPDKLGLPVPGSKSPTLTPVNTCTCTRTPSSLGMLFSPFACLSLCACF